jgi:hypothetical protein
MNKLALLVISSLILSLAATQSCPVNSVSCYNVDGKMSAISCTNDCLR